MNAFTQPAAWAVQRVTVVLSVLVGLVTLAPAFTMAAFEAKVVGVADGDTLTVLHDDKTRDRIRLHGQCPSRAPAPSAAMRGRRARNVPELRRPATLPSSP